MTKQQSQEGNFVTMPQRNYNVIINREVENEYTRYHSRSLY